MFLVSLRSAHLKKMITGEIFAEMALSLQGAEQTLHFDRVGYKVTGRRMFATYWQKNNTANIFLTPSEQSIFCKMGPNIYPVPNKWGEKGATTFELNQVEKEIVMEALISAYGDIINATKKR